MTETRRGSRQRKPSHKQQTYSQLKLALSPSPAKQVKKKKRTREPVSLVTFTSSQVLSLREKNKEVVAKMKKPQLRCLADLVEVEAKKSAHLKTLWKDRASVAELVELLTDEECFSLICKKIDQLSIEDVAPKTPKRSKKSPQTPKNLASIVFGTLEHKKQDVVYLLSQVGDKVYNTAKGRFVNDTIDPDIYPDEDENILDMCSLVALDHVEDSFSHLDCIFGDKMMRGLTVAWRNDMIISKDDFERKSGLLSRYSSSNQALKDLENAESVFLNGQNNTEIVTEKTTTDLATEPEPIVQIEPSGQSSSTVISVLTKRIEELETELQLQKDEISRRDEENEYLIELVDKLAQVEAKAKNLYSLIRRVKRPSDKLKKVAKFKFLSHTMKDKENLIHFKIRLSSDDWDAINSQSGKEKVKVCLLMLQEKYGVDFTTTGFVLVGASSKVLESRFSWDKSKKSELVRFVNSAFPSVEKDFVEKKIGQVFTEFDKELNDKLEDEAKIFDRFDPHAKTIVMKKGGVKIHYEYVPWDGQTKVGSTSRTVGL